MKRNLLVFTALLLLPSLLPLPAQPSKVFAAKATTVIPFVPIYDNTGIGVNRPCNWLERALSGWTKTLCFDIAVAKPYCLTFGSAGQLAMILRNTEPVIVPRPAQGYFPPGPVTQVGTVPYLHFPDGTEVNAGKIAAYWSHGYDPVYAESQARADIWVRMQATASGTPILDLKKPK